MCDSDKKCKKALYANKLFVWLDRMIESSFYEQRTEKHKRDKVQNNFWNGLKTLSLCVCCKTKLSKSTCNNTVSNLFNIAPWADHKNIFRYQFYFKWKIELKIGTWMDFEWYENSKGRMMLWKKCKWCTERWILKFSES